MTTYWTIAHRGEHPSVGTPQNTKDVAIEPDDCLVFSSRKEAAGSDLANDVVFEGDDLAPDREAVELYARPNSQKKVFSGGGVYVKVHSIVSRAPFLEWLESLAESEDPDEVRVAEAQLAMYRKIRDAALALAPE